MCTIFALVIKENEHLEILRFHGAIIIIIIIIINIIIIIIIIIIININISIL